MEKTASDYSSYKFHEGETINVTKIGGSGASFSYYATKVDSDNYNYENQLYYESVETDETTESGSHKVKPYDSQLEEGYHFRYWKLNKLGSNYGHFVAVLGSNTYEYPITYEYKDGTAPATPNPTYFTYNEGTTIYAPTREGYTFDGWEGTDKIAGNGIEFEDGNKTLTIKNGSFLIEDEPVILTAKWLQNINEVIVTYNSENQAFGCSTSEVNINGYTSWTQQEEGNYTTSVTLSAATGYCFASTLAVKTQDANGNEISGLSSAKVLNDDGTLTITYTDTDKPTVELTLDPNNKSYQAGGANAYTGEVTVNV